MLNLYLHFLSLSNTTKLLLKNDKLHPVSQPATALQFKDLTHVESNYSRRQHRHQHPYHRVKKEEEEEEINKGINILQVTKSSQCIINQSQVKTNLHRMHVFDAVYEGTGKYLLNFYVSC